MKTQTTPAVTWPPGGTGSQTSTASPGRASTDFGALLDTHQARTATAEGPKKQKSLEKHEARTHRPAEPAAERPRDRERPSVESKPVDKHAETQPRRDDAQVKAGEQPQPQPQAEDQTKVEAPVAEAPVAVDPLLELTVPVLAEAQAPVAAPVAEQAVPAAGPQAQASTPQQVVPTAQPVAVAAPVAEQTAATPVPTGQAVTTTTTTTGEQPVPAQQPVPAPAGEQPVAVEGDAPAAETPVARADRPAQTQQQPSAQRGEQQPQQQGGGEQKPSDQQHPPAQQQQQPQGPVAADASRAARNPSLASQQQPQAQPVAAVTTPAAVAAPQAPVAQNTASPLRSVSLSSAAEAVENVIRIGSQKGVTHARMSLKPAELGGIEIRLQQTASGLVASVVADGAEAAQALQQAGQDLRRQLEAQGIELQRLDISHSGEERSDARSAETRTGDGERRSSTGDNSTATDGGDLNPNDEATATSTLELPDGVLVDVLA